MDEKGHRMHHRWLEMVSRCRDALSDIRSPVGRMEFLNRNYLRLWPVVSRAARVYRQFFLRRTTIVAVVGSFGKSTTARSVWAALGGDPQKLSQRNAGSFVARELLHVRPWQRYAVIEVGIGGIGQMAPVAKMLQPDITVVTCIGSEHNRSLLNLENTRHEKAAMLRVMKTGGLAVLNGDDPNVRWMAGQTRARVLFFGVDAGNEVRASHIEIDWPHGTRFQLHAGGHTHAMQVRLLGRHMAYPILAAAAVAFCEGIQFEKAQSRLECLTPTPGRMQVVPLPSGAYIIRDEYKATLETIYAALDTLAEIPGRRILCIGAVSEPPQRLGPMYEQLGRKISGIATRTILVSQKRVIKYYRSSLTRAGYSSKAIVSVRQRRDGGGSMQKAVDIIVQDLKPGDVVLIKGLDRQRFERIAYLLMGMAVRCDIDFCGVKVFTCEHCPRLAAGENMAF